MSCSIITVKNASKKPKYAHRSRSYHNPKVIKSENFEHGFEKNKVEICNIEKNPFYLQQKSSDDSNETSKILENISLISKIQSNLHQLENNKQSYISSLIRKSTENKPLRICRNDLKESAKVKAIKLKTIDFSVDNEEEMETNEELGSKRKLELELEFEKCEGNVNKSIQTIFDDFYMKNRGKKPNLFK